MDATSSNAIALFAALACVLIVLLLLVIDPLVRRVNTHMRETASMLMMSRAVEDAIRSGASSARLSSASARALGKVHAAVVTWKALDG